MLERLLGDLVPFRILLPDAEQTDGGMRFVKDVLGILVPHECELGQLGRRAVHRGTHIQEDGVAHQRREQRRDGRPLDALQDTQQEKRGDHGGARVPGADDGDRLAFLDQLRADPDRGVPLAADDLRGLLVHLDPLGGVVHRQARQIPDALPAEFRLEQRVFAHQDDLDSVLTHRQRGTLDLRGRGVIATHRIQCDLHLEHGPRVRPLRRR